MLLIAAAVDENIIEEDQYKFAQIGCQGCVHSTEKRCPCSSETERHHIELKLPVMGLESGFVLFSLRQANLVIAST